MGNNPGGCAPSSTTLMYNQEEFSNVSQVSALLNVCFALRLL